MRSITGTGGRSKGLPGAGGPLQARSGDADLERLIGMLRRQTLDREEKRFVKQALWEPLRAHPAMGWAHVPAPSFSPPPKKGVNQYAFKIWAVPKGFEDFPWAIPHVRNKRWKGAQHGCYLELVGETGASNHPLNHCLFWGVKVSGSDKKMKSLRRDVERAGLHSLRHTSPHARPYHGLLSTIGIRAVWYLLGFEAREPALRGYRGLDELLADISAGLTAAHGAFDAFAGGARRGGTLVSRAPGGSPADPRGSGPRVPRGRT